MQRLPVFLAVTLAMIALSPAATPAQVGPSLLVFSDDTRVHDHVMSLIRQQVRVISRPGDVSAVKQEVASMDGPMVVLQTTYDVPSTADLQQAFDAIGDASSNVTYVLFVDESEDMNWVSELDLPDNLRFAVSVRTMDQESVAAAYAAYKINYDASNLEYDYHKAAYLALQQLSQSDAGATDLAIEPWTSRAATMFFDGGIIQSGAHESDAAALTEAIKGEPSIHEIDQRDFEGITNPQIKFSSIQNDMDAVRAATLLAKCTGIEVWDKFIENNISFLAFGQAR